MRPSLESLLVASSHMLKEVLDGPFVDPLKNLRLPRELNPNKKYSWMQKKDERVRCPRPGLGGWGAGAGCPREATSPGPWPALRSEGPVPQPASTTGLLGGPGQVVSSSRVSVYHVITCQECIPWVTA